MKNRANYLICLMEILFQLKKIRYLLKINEGDIYKPDMKNKDFFDIFKTICYNIDYIEKIINKSYYKYEIKIICFKYEYTETHLFISNKIDEYKQDHINNQYTLIKKALTKIIELTDIYNNFYKDDITGENFYKDYQYEYKIKYGNECISNNKIEIYNCLGEFEPDDLRAIRSICETENDMLKTAKPKINKKFLDSIKSILKI